MSLGEGYYILTLLLALVQSPQHGFESNNGEKNSQESEHSLKNCLVAVY